MKICQLCNVDFALKTLLLPLVDRMHETGWEVVCVCAQGEQTKDMLQAGYHIQTVPISRDITDIFTHFIILIKLYRLFRREKFDVLHVHTPIAAFLGRIAGRLAGIPLIIYTVHGFYFHEDMNRIKYLMFLTLERILGHWTDFMLTQSQEDKETALSKRIIAAENIKVIGNGVDPNKFKPLGIKQKNLIRSEFDIPKDAIVIGIICRMVREKGIVELLKAGIGLADRFPNLYFLFVGGRIASERGARLDREWQVAKNSLGARLIATGFRYDTPRLLTAMDVFCLPSWREGMPRSIIEAMMIGLPVVATNIRGCREEVVVGKTGYLVPPKHIGELQNALRTLIEDKTLRTKMGALGRKRALKLYDERKILSLQIKMISELAKQKSSFINASK